MLWIMIGLMTAITFYNRYAFFSPRIKFSIRPEIQSVLQYTAPAILTALWVPIVFIKDNAISTNPDNPYLVAGVITIAVSLLLKKPLLIVLIGLLFFSLLSFYIN